MRLGVLVLQRRGGPSDNVRAEYFGSSRAHSRIAQIIDESGEVLVTVVKLVINDDHSMEARVLHHFRVSCAFEPRTVRTARQDISRVEFDHGLSGSFFLGRQRRHPGNGHRKSAELYVHQFAGDGFRGGVRDGQIVITRIEIGVMIVLERARQSS